MKVSIEIAGLDSVLKRLQQHSGQVRFATTKALTTTAHDVRKAVVKKLEASLDRPKPFTTRQAVQVIAATKDSLVASVGLGIKYDAPSKGTSYDKALGHLFTGGARSWKKVEGAFRRIGALPEGWIIVPGKACPLDSYGNVPARFLVQLISYFNASSEQGYKANMSDRRRRQLARLGRTASGYKTINGVQYFISHGRMRNQHLQPGVWSRTGIHGVDVKPILMFVRMGTWKRYIDLPAIATDVVRTEFEKNFSSALINALRTAR